MFFINIIVPLISGLIYFFMAYEIKRVSKYRKLIFGELGYRRAFIGFLLFGFYLITRPLQNILGPHPNPMIVNCMRQFFLMGIIAPSILVGIFHWAAVEWKVPKAAEVSSYVIGFLMAVIFILINVVAIDGSKVIAEWNGFRLYDALWFSKGDRRIELILIHLIVQGISPVGFLLLAAGYVRHRRHNYPPESIYNLMPLKWKFLETGLIIIAFSFIFAGFAAFFGHYYTYLWLIYYLGALIAGIIELKGVRLPPKESPEDLKREDK